MEEKLAKVISVVFQPLLIPTFSLLMLFSLNSYISMSIPFQAKRMLAWIIFVTTFILPLLFILILYKRGFIKTLNMDEKEERIFPLVITGIFYFLAYYIVRQTQLDTIYQRMFLGSAIIIIVSLMVSFYWKISMHMIAVGGLFGALIGIHEIAYVDLTLYLVATTFVCGLVGFARLKLKAHTPAQVYAGFFSGAILMLGMFVM